MDNNVMSTGKNKAKRVYSMYLDADASRSTWARQASEDQDFYNGKHYTAREVTEMELKGMMPIAVDRTMPVINAEVAIFTSTRPTFKALAREDGDVKIAALWSDILTWIWQQNDGDSQYQQCIQDYFSKGAGYMVISVDPYGDDGEGSILMNYTPVWDVYPDPNSRNIDLSDARYIIVSRLISRSVIEFNYPDQVARIKKAQTETGVKSSKPEMNTIPIDGTSGYAITQADYLHIDSVNDDQDIRMSEMYERVRIPYWKVIDQNTGITEVYPAKDYNPKEQATPGQLYMKIFRTRIKVTATLGDNITLYTAILPTDTYPVIPFFLHHSGTPYPRSDISVIKGMQREVNKRRSIMVHNASMQSNYKVLAQHGALHNKNKWETSGSQAGSVLEYNQGFDKPEQWFAGQLPAAWFQMEGLAKEDIEYALSVFSNMMGDPGSAPDTYRGLLALEERGQQKIKFKVQHANHSLRRLGRVMLQYAQALFKMPKIMRIAGENSESYKTLYINQIVMDPITGKPRTINDISVGTYDLHVYDGTSMPTNRMALLNLYMEMYQMGIIDKAEVLKKTDVVDREEVLKRMGEVQQISAQAEALQGQVKDIDGLNTTLRRQNQQLQLKISALEASMSVEKDLNRTQVEQSLVRGRIADRLSLLDQQAKLALREVKIQGAEAGIALKQARQTATRNSVSKT